MGMIDLPSTERKQGSIRQWAGMKLIGVAYLILVLMLIYYTFLNSIVFSYLDISIRNYGYPLLIFHLIASSIAIIGLWKSIKEYKALNKKYSYLILPLLTNLLLHGMAVSSFATYFQSLPL
jgi:uncharacterized membrane protein